MCSVSCLHFSFTVSSLQALNSTLTSDFFNKNIQIFISSISGKQTFLSCQQRNYDKLDKVQITSFALLKFKCKPKFSDQFKEILLSQEPKVWSSSMPILWLTSEHFELVLQIAPLAQAAQVPLLSACLQHPSTLFWRCKFSFFLIYFWMKVRSQNINF